MVTAGRTAHANADRCLRVSMAWLLLPIIATFILGIVSFFYGIQAANDNLLLLGIVFWVITLTLFLAWGREINRRK